MSFAAQLGVIGEVALAMLLGGLIGFEREIANKPAGFRTHMLVAGSAAFLVGLGDAFLARLGGSPHSSLIQSDPMRIIEAIITGISFLGAGTIFRRKEGEHIEGLTTAASILLSSTVGISVALRQLGLAMGVTALALLVLRGLRFIEQLIHRKRGPAR